MATEILNIGQIQTEHTVIKAAGDGACLFRSLSYHVLGTMDNHLSVRRRIVAYVLQNWENFGNFTQKANGDSYNFNEYQEQMSLTYTFGGAAEIKAASILFNTKFEVYRNRELYCQYGNSDTIKRLRFRGSLSSGHFDAYIPYHSSINNLEPEFNIAEQSTPTKKRGRPSKTIRSNDKVGRPKKGQTVSQPTNTSILEVVDNSQSISEINIDLSNFYINDENISKISTSKSKRGRPFKTRSKNDNITIINRPIVEILSTNNNLSNNKRGRPKKRQSVSQQLTNTSINEISASKSKRGRPSKHSKEQNSQTREENAKYLTSNEQSRKDANNIERHSQVHRDSVAPITRRYSQEYPPALREAVGLNRSTNPRNVVIIHQNLRLFSCLGVRSGTGLKDIASFQLKVGSLSSSEIYKCEHCNAPLFEEEKSRKKWCCGEGTFNVHNLPYLNAPFYEKEEFKKNARSYNNLFAFSAIGTSHGFQGPPGGRGVSFVKVQGRIYHRIFDLSYNKTVNNTALYIHDGAEHINMAETLNLNPEITQEIYTYLSEVNPLIHLLLCLNDHPSENAHLVFQNTSRSTHGPILGDNHFAPEISALIETSSNHEPRQVCIWKVGEAKPHTVHYLNPAYESLQHPLFSCNSWQLNLLTKSGTKLSQTKYYRHKLLSDSRFTKLRRLAQEWTVDMWCRAEEEKLAYLRNNQSTVLRMATRTEIDETIVGEGPIAPGKIYLPASYTNGPRYMQVKYQDAMAIVSRLGKPSFFLTVTCNPRWPEIVNSLHSGESFIDRPDLCGHVFQIKLQKLTQLIKSGKLFGKIISFMQVIEFQKRGLPHAHMAFRVEGGGPVITTDMDSFVRATIPSVEEADGRLRQLVLHHMIHNECGINNQNAHCMDSNTKKCSKHFPKNYQDVTSVDNKGFILYKRPNGDTATLPSGRVIDNQWIVPYNPAVLLFMESHCNLEIATGAKVVKYLYKYIHKGPDFANATVHNTERVVDEIENFVNFRYVSASEAVHRIFEFNICCRTPNVIALPIHLPNEESIIFRQGDEQRAKEASYSKLLLYINRPKITELINLTYLEFYEQYNVDSKPRPRAIVPIIEHESGKHFITKRVRDKCVARIYFISPNLGEIYFLRMLLARFSCVGFEDLRTVDGVIYESFQRAAFVRGILNDSNEFREAMCEAAGFKTGNTLRNFFFSLIMFGAPAALLWDEFQNDLCEDFLLRFPENPARAFNLGLCELDHLLRSHSRTLTDFGLPAVADETTELGRETTRWTNVSCEQFLETWQNKLSLEQTLIYNKLCETSITNDESKANVFFVEGAAGSGKTLLLNVITAKLRSEGKIVLCTASTGIAAINHNGGITAHSMFRLPIEVDDDQAVWKISNNSQRAQLIKKSTLIIIDEATMAHKNILQAFEKGMRDLFSNAIPFGGKFIVFSGDFRQIPPIVQYGSRDDVVSASIKNANFWKSVIKYSLKSSQRNKDDQPYADFLLRVGEDRIPKIILNDNMRVVPLDGVPHVTDLTELINFVYPVEVLKDREECCKSAILSGTNEIIKDINNSILNKIEGDVIHCYSADKVVVSSETDLNQHLDPSLLTPFINQVYQTTIYN